MPDRQLLAKTEMALRCSGVVGKKVALKCSGMQGCCVGRRWGARSCWSMVQVAAITKTNRVSVAARSVRCPGNVTQIGGKEPFSAFLP